MFVNHVMMSMLFLTYLSVKIDYQDFHKKSEYYCETAFLNVQRTYIIVFSTIKLTAEKKSSTLIYCMSSAQSEKELDFLYYK